ncbi:retention module-containing protein, partial [Methylophaga sp.]|uniref:retention module-containing protein n=1 Tax=Methylophaga sp. TaxID=2024840 RepID=UPI003F69626C
MANEIGFVKLITGVVNATAPDGTTRTLQAGDKVFANEVISTANGAAVEIEFLDGSVMDLGRESQAMLDSLVFDLAEAAESEQESVLDDVAAIQQALLSGDDPTLELEATAAGAGTQTGNEGHDAVFVDYLNPTAEVNAGFETVGVSSTFDQPEEDLIVLNEPVPEVLSPSLSVSVGVGVSVEGDPLPNDPVDVFIPAGTVLPVGVNSININELTSEDGTHPVTFFISLSEPVEEPVTISYRVDPGTALIPDDYTDGDIVGTVTIPVGNIGFTVTLNIVEDAIPEANETFSIILTSVEGAVLSADNTATVTIVDDDVLLSGDKQLADETVSLASISGELEPDYGPGDTGTISLTLSGGTWSGDVTGDGTSSISADDGSWSMTVNADGRYQFTQKSAFDHPDTGNSNEPLTFEFTLIATDSSGNTSNPVPLSITILDDGPSVNVGSVDLTGISLQTDDADIATEGGDTDSASFA